MSDDQNPLRDQLAAALPESLGPVGLRHRAIPELDDPGGVTGYGQMLLDAILPTVEANRERAQAEAAAKALEQAADEATPWLAVGSKELRDRAASLRARADLR